jgi:uncharacterized protein YjlB
MANIIRIRRRTSGATGAPSGLKNAELAFNEVDETLYYGKGDSSGDATSILAIAGPGAFVGLTGTQTITGNKTFSGTIALDGSTTVTTQTLGDNSTKVATTAFVAASITAAGSYTGFKINGDSGTEQQVDSGNTVVISGGTGLSSVAGSTDTITINLDNTAVTAGSYGSASAIPTFTVDAQGRLTAAGTASISTSFMVDADSGDNLTISGGDTFVIVGGTGLTSVASATDTLTLNLDNTAVNAGSYGSASSVGTFTVDAQGRLTAAGTTSIEIALGTNTSGNYMSGLTEGTGVTITHTPSEGSNATIAIGQSVATSASPTFAGLTISGDLTVNGTTTTINSTEITIDDKNLTLGSVATPTDAGADGGGITLKGTTDKTFNWVDATDAWTSSENLDLISGKSLLIAGTSVLSGSTLGSGVTASSLTSVGTITTGVWNATTIAIANGGTGSTDASGARTALGLAIGTNVQAYNANLGAIAGLTSASDSLPYFTGSGTAALTTLTTAGRALLDDADASAQRTTLGLGTIATQAANNVSITGGSIDGITFDGGTF